MKKKIYFVIILPEKTQSQIRDFLKNLQVNPKFKKMPLTLTQGENLHITLTFLGAVKDEAKNAAITGAEMASLQSLPFELKVPGISYFYRSKTWNGSTIYLDIADSEKKLKNLHKTLSKYLVDADFSPAGHFTPHITIARLPRQRLEHEQKRILDQVSEIEVAGIEPFMVDKFTLVEVQNIDSLNPRYSVIKKFVLGG